MHFLWLKTELLHPVDKGGRIRTFQMLRALRCEHQITYLTLDDGTAASDAPQLAAEYCHELVRVPFVSPRKATAAFYRDLVRNVFSRLPYAIAKYRSRAMRRAILRTLQRGGFDVVVCDFLFPSVNVPDGLAVPTLLFQHNVESSIWERHAGVAVHPIARWYMREQWRRMRRWEGRECHRFDHVVAVSETDRDAFRRMFGVEHVSAVPTGVDTAYFAPAGGVPDPYEIVFTGSMDWMPNEDGISWFCREVLPRIRVRVPGAKLTIVGRNPTPRIRALETQHPGVTVTGTVPDVRPYLASAAVLAVPLRVAGGTRLKIYEGMAMGRPIVATTIGAEGLPVESGREILLADTPDAFAGAVVHLLSNSDEAEELGRRGAARVRRDFSWERAAEDFAATCRDVVARHQHGCPAKSGRVPA